MADDLRQVADLARAARAGEIPAPDIDMAALFAGPDFFKDPRTQAAARGLPPGGAPFMRAVTADLDLDEAMAEAKGSGARAAKIYADLSAAEVTALTAAAHRRGLLVFAHAAVFPARPSDVVAAGVDSVSHVCMLGYEISRTPPRAYHDRAPVDAAALAGPTPPALLALLAEMRRRGVVLDATLRVYRELDAAHAARPLGPAPYCGLELAARLARAARDAGVELSAGTDGVSPAADPWPALQDELDLLQDRAGLTPLEVLRAATLGGARALGREEELGSIAPGKLADLTFTAKNPLAAAAAFRTVVLTVKRGRLYWRRDAALAGPAAVSGG
jgi:imidazolonepropionase-like amidohydrolase